MTKVILPGTDERGECKNADPEVADGSLVEKIHRWASALQGVQKKEYFHGPRCFKQSVGDLCREQPEQHQQQFADGAATVVLGLEDQLRGG
jgi:hypothetical protein